MAWLKTNQKQYKNEQKRIDEYMDYKTEKALKAHKESSVLDHPNGSVTDEKIGERTVVDASADSGDFTGLFSAIINNIANAIRSIRANFNSHKNNNYIHIKDLERQSWNNILNESNAALEKAIEEQRVYVDAQDSSVLTAANNFTREKVNEVNDFAQTLDRNIASIQEDLESANNEIADIKTVTAEIGDDVETNADKLNSLKYYGDMNIVPSDASLFTFTTDDETMTASVSAAPNGISGDIVIPYQYVVGDKVYLVTSVAENGFDECFQLTGVKMPNSLKIIGDYAFFDCCRLNSINIPYGVTHIWNCAFSYTQMTEVDIPDSVTYIGEYAFYSCNTLIEITIPDSVTYIGSGAFYDCMSLEQATLSKNMTTVCLNTFKGCPKLAKINIPNGIAVLENQAFMACLSIASIILPSSVSDIGAHSFSGCLDLTNITISNNVVNIGNYAFENCDNLSDVYYEGTEDEWNAITISATGNAPLLSATIHYNWVPAMKNYVDEQIKVVNDGVTTVERKIDDVLEGETLVPGAIKADADAEGNIFPDHYATKNELSTVESIAKGANQAVSFENYQLMYEDLSVWSEKYHVGQNIYIKTLNVPDLWVSEIIEYDDGFDYVQTLNPPLFDEFDEAAFLEELKTNGSIQVGVYVVSMLETQKVDLTEYATKEEVSAELGDIETALDNIIAIQNTLIGGETV